MNPVLTDIYNRNELVWGKHAQQELFKKHVIVLGLGGVGSYIAEALARSGVGTLTLLDFDTVSETNINRQLPALIPDIGKPKTVLMKERISLINPHIKVKEVSEFASAELIDKIADKNIDFIADAIDTLKSKVDIIELAGKKDIPIITCLGAGNRIKPEELYIADISEIDTKKCPFSGNIIRQLRKRGIEKGVQAIASREKPFKTSKTPSVIKVNQPDGSVMEINKLSPGSSPFVPPVAGYMMAGFIVRELIRDFI